MLPVSSNSTLGTPASKPALGITKRCDTCGCEAVWLDLDGDYRCLLCSRVRIAGTPGSGVDHMVEALFSQRQYVARKQRIFT